ncbi:MAG: Hsp20/alpha crystallin family protein [Deltaproteobacteria bacterium]|nr:Hsp20/alpha crystallin family protein [Deltaproteobacteria bacterium]
MFALKKWEPMKEFTTIQREMDELARRFFGSFTGLRREFAGEFTPTMDCYMKNGQFIVHAELPGIEAKDVDISITGNLLTIRGERKSVVDEKKTDYLFHESSFGSFERTMTLPEGVDTGKVHATCKNGVLELTMPTKAEALPKKVKIEIEEGNKEGRKAA